MLLEALGFERLAHLQNELPVGEGRPGLAQDGLDGVAEGPVRLATRGLSIRRGLLRLASSQQDADLAGLAAAPSPRPRAVLAFRALRCCRVVRRLF